MRSRQLLAVHAMERFAAWAESVGYKRLETKGTYEVLRLRQDGGKPIIFYRKLSTNAGKEPVHLTSFDEGTRLVLRWIKERHEPVSRT